MFDSLLQEIANKFGLGNKASSILSTLLGLMFKSSDGGMSGFLDKLTQGGLGKMVESWLGKDEPMPVNSTQIESALGSNVITNLAAKLGLASGPVGMAVAYIIPKIVSALTPDGVIPDSIPAGIAHYINDDGQTESESPALEPTPEPVPEKTPEPIPEPAPTQQEQYTQASESSGEGFRFRWWWLLLPLFLLLGLCTLQQPEETLVTTPEPTMPAPTTPEVVSEPAIPVTPIPSINSSLSISNETDSFNVSGTVANNATKESIFGMLNSIVGSDKVNGDIHVDPAAKDAGWLAKLSGILLALKDAPGANLRLDGDDITLDGNLEQSMIDGLMGKLNGIFAGDGFNISSQAVALASSTESQIHTDETSGKVIRDMVDSGSVTAESLISALNVAGINFASGSFDITPDSMAVLADAAKAIKLAPADIHIQVGGHTDNTGSSEINTKLSKQRAQAVVDELISMGINASMLSSKGYGDSQPVADNNSEAGRAQNRRMEFTLQ